MAAEKAAEKVATAEMNNESSEEANNQSFKTLINDFYESFEIV